MTDEARIRNYIQTLGLESAIADLYLALYQYGPQTISELARTSRVERTLIYRLLKNLKASALIEVEVRYKRAIYKAAPITNLRLLVSEKDQELQHLQAELPLVERAFSQQTLASPTTRVQFYEGASGVKQVFWNETKAHTEVLSILHKNMQTDTREAFFERWVRRCNEQGLHFRGLVSDGYANSQRLWYSSHQNERLAHWEARYVPPEVFAMTHGTVIYNDVVYFQDWKDHETFGIEIYNQQVADTQRQLFELLWAQAKPLKDAYQGDQ